jgi:single-strand DNA-binding protein
MANLNKVILAGNLTKDPEVRYTPAGKAVADLRMAINRSFKGQDGQVRDETCFVSVVVWDRQAQTCGEYLTRGSPVLVDGRLQYEEWEKDGQKFNRLRVVADRVQFLGSPAQGRGGDAARGEGGGRKAAAQPPAESPDRRSGPVDVEEPPVGAKTDNEEDLPF